MSGEETQSDGPREEGTVKWYNEEKGYGFIEKASDGRDLFVHYTQVKGTLKQGDPVDFTIGEGRKGPCANDVRLKK